MYYCFPILYLGRAHALAFIYVPYFVDLEVFVSSNFWGVTGSVDSDDEFDQQIHGILELDKEAVTLI